MIVTVKDNTGKMIQHIEINIQSQVMPPAEMGMKPDENHKVTTYGYKAIDAGNPDLATAGIWLGSVEIRGLASQAGVVLAILTNIETKRNEDE